MIRFSTQRFQGDHFNFSPQDVGNGILDNGIFGNPNAAIVVGYKPSWQSALDNTTDGIIADENIDLRKPLANYSKKTVEVLGELSKKGKKISVWHSVRLSKQLAKVYATDAIDYVFIESYWPWKWRPLLWLFFKHNYNVAHRAGIEHKLVFGLGINQNHPKFRLKDVSNWWSEIPWCNDKKTLVRQLRYIKEKCLNIAGLGFFVLDASDSFMRTADEITFQLFGD